jgi:hypothetical protein
MRKLVLFFIAIITKNKNNQRDRRSRFWDHRATNGWSLKKDKMLVET